MDKYSDESGNNQREDSGKYELPKGELQGTPEHGNHVAQAATPWIAGRPEMGKWETMASKKQRAAARNNIKKAAGAAKRKQTLKNLPKKTRRALGKQAAKARESGGN